MTGNVIAWLILGAVAGWIAKLLMGGRGGLLRNIIVGIVGALVGGWVASLVGLQVSTFSWGGLAVAAGGACLCIFLARRVFK